MLRDARIPQARTRGAFNAFRRHAAGAAAFLLAGFALPTIANGQACDWRQWTPQLPAAASGSDAGSSVATDGETLVMGAEWQGGHGSVHVSTRSPHGWSAPVQITANDLSPGDRFGSAVAISGNTIAVAAVGQEPPQSAFYGRGAVYVYVRTGTDWTLQQKLFPDEYDFGEGFQFGAGIALEGDRLLITAPTRAVRDAQNPDVIYFEMGSVYCYLRSSGEWMNHQIITPTAADPTNHHFGTSVDIDGDRCIVGAVSWTVVQPPGGYARIYRLIGDTWTHEALLQPPIQGLSPLQAHQQHEFGRSVAIDADHCAIGDSIGGASSQGSITIFQRSGTAWTQEQVLASPSSTPETAFGFNVAMDGEIIVAGAPVTGAASVSNVGALHAFRRSGTLWSHDRSILGERVVDTRLGTSVTVGADVVAVGARGFYGRGGVFIYDTACSAASPECAADFDRDGVVAVPDIFAFLSAWFAGCP